MDKDRQVWGRSEQKVFSYDLPQTCTTASPRLISKHCPASYLDPQLRYGLSSAHTDESVWADALIFQVWGGKETNIFFLSAVNLIGQLVAVYAYSKVILCTYSLCLIVPSDDFWPTKCNHFYSFFRALMNIKYMSIIYSKVILSPYSWCAFVYLLMTSELPIWITSVWARATLIS